MRSNILVRALLVIFFALTVALGGAVVLAFAQDYKTFGSIPEGTTVDDIDLSGKTEEEARELLQAKATEEAQVTVNLTVGDTVYPVDLTNAVTYDVEPLVSQAIEPIYHETAFDRIERQIKKYQGTYTPEQRNLSIEYKLDPTAVKTELEKIAGETNVTPVDATREFSGDKVVITPESSGKIVDVEASYQAAIDALEFNPETGAHKNGVQTVPVVYTEIAPTVTAGSFGKSIIINLSTLNLYLYDGESLEKSYRIGAGKPGYESPTGLLEITAKRKNPVWINPSPNGWGKNMPEKWGPGPTAPLGLRALNLNRPAIRIHGVHNTAKIGIYGSHGCFNLTNPDVVDLFDRVEVGTPVYVHK